MIVNNINELVKILKIYMIENNKTQADIWKTLNIKQANVSRSLSGKNNISLQTLLDYIDALDAKLDISIVNKEGNSTSNNTECANKDNA